MGKRPEKRNRKETGKKKENGKRKIIKKQGRKRRREKKKRRKDAKEKRSNSRLFKERIELKRERPSGLSPTLSLPSVTSRCSSPRQMYVFFALRLTISSDSKTLTMS